MSRSVQDYLRIQRISEALQRWPWLYIEVQKIRDRRKSFVRWIVTSRHAVMIGGFPRSDTNFAAQAHLPTPPLACRPVDHPSHPHQNFIHCCHHRAIAPGSNFQKR